jgi:hypothetical protein
MSLVALKSRLRADQDGRPLSDAQNKALEALAAEYEAKLKAQEARIEQVAREAYEKDGRKLINCTPGSGCKKLEFGDYKDY